MGIVLENDFTKLCIVCSKILRDVRGETWFFLGIMIFEILVGQNTPSIDTFCRNFWTSAPNGLCHAHAQIWPENLAF